MKLNILPAIIKKEVGPKYRITIDYYEYDGFNIFSKSETFLNLTPEIEKFIRLLRIIDENYFKAKKDYDKLWFGDYDCSIFSNPLEDSVFLRNFEFNGIYLIQNCVDDGLDISYKCFHIEYLDENGDWHNVEIED